MNKIVSFIEGESGASAVEYAILLAAIAALMLGTIFQAGGVNGLIFGRNQDAITSAMSP